MEMPLKDVFDFPLEPGEAVMVVKEGHPPYAAKRQAGQRVSDRSS